MDASAGIGLQDIRPQMEFGLDIRSSVFRFRLSLNPSLSTFKLFRVVLSVSGILFSSSKYLMSKQKYHYISLKTLTDLKFYHLFHLFSCTVKIG